jgi:hypothetical protein
MHFSRLLAGVSLVCLFVLTGCGGGAQWKVAVENKSAQACTVAVTLGADGKSNAKVDVTPGGSVTLIAGSADTLVNTITVTRGTDVKTIPHNSALSAGKQCTITIAADGTVAAATPK